MPALLAVIGVIALVLLASRTASAAPASVRFARPSPPSEAIGRFAEAIAVAEGFGIPNAIPTRANNPGDLALGGKTLGTDLITIFVTPEEGWTALYHQLERIRDGRSNYYRADMTILDMAQVYAPGPGASSWAANVARTLGVVVVTKIGSLL